MRVKRGIIHCRPCWTGNVLILWLWSTASSAWIWVLYTYLRHVSVVTLECSELVGSYDARDTAVRDRQTTVGPEISVCRPIVRQCGVIIAAFGHFLLRHISRIDNPASILPPPRLTGTGPLPTSHLSVSPWIVCRVQTSGACTCWMIIGFTGTPNSVGTMGRSAPPPVGPKPKSLWTGDAQQTSGFRRVFCNSIKDQLCILMASRLTYDVIRWLLQQAFKYLMCDQTGLYFSGQQCCTNTKMQCKVICKARDKLK